MGARGSYKRKPVEVAPSRGWTAGYPVLTPDQVRTIRTRLSEGATKYRLGKDYGVTPQAIMKIERGITHKGVV